MAARSTRQKIRDQAAKMINSCDDIAYHLKNLFELADGGSEVIEKFSPLILELQDTYLNILIQFRAEL